VIAVGPDGEATVLPRALAVTQRTATVVDVDELAQAARLGRFAKAAPITGGVLAAASAGIDQWREDSGDPDLTTTDRVGRSVGVGAYVGGAAVAGAAIGTFICPVGGTAVGAAAGAVGGLVFGAAASSITPAKHAAAAVGQWTANRVEDVGHGVKSVLDDINPF
jgi:hypothetical protein